MHGRGRGVAGPMGRGRLMPNKQNLRVVECKPQPCVVSVEGLSSSTTDVQLKSLLMSVGPIQVGCLYVMIMPVGYLSRTVAIVGYICSKMVLKKKNASACLTEFRK